MQNKIETTQQDANIFIYDKMDPEGANLILLAKVELLKKQQGFAPIITKLEQDGGNLWLIRDSRVEGLLTVQSVSYSQTSSEWVPNSPVRFMLSNNSGWIINNNAPGTVKFEQVASHAGGLIKLTQENVTPHLPGLLSLLSSNGYSPENRVNPKLGEETKTIGYSDYVIPQKIMPSNHNFKFGTSVSLPEGILIALSCPLTTKKTGEAKLIKDPVTLVSDGITYERASLLEEYANQNLQEGKDFYPNIRLKAIINYVSATSLPPEEYLVKLAKVENDIQDPILLIDMEEPVLSPSGHSYEKASLENWIKSKQNVSHMIPIPDPVTKEDIRGKPIINNVNLKQFIKAWPDFYQEQKEKCLSLQLEDNSKKF